MPRVKRGTKRRAKRKKILERASGFFLTKSKLYRSAKESVERALKFAFTGRRQKKRQYRSLWIVRIGAAANAQRSQLQPVRERPEEGGRGTGSQDPRRPGRERCRGLYGPRRTGQGRAGVEGSPGIHSRECCRSLAIESAKAGGETSGLRCIRTNLPQIFADERG